MADESARVLRGTRPLVAAGDATQRASVALQRLRLLGVSLVVGCALWAIFTWVRASVERNVKAQLAAQLQVTLDAAVAGAVAELEAAGRAASATSQDVELRAMLRSCLAMRPACNEAADSHLWLALQSKLGRVLSAGHFARVRCASPDGSIQLSIPGDVPGTPWTRRELERGGREAPPAILWPEEPAGVPAISFVGSLSSPAGTLGALAFDLPISWWSRILLAARAGESGETYAFDARGLLLSESRFTGALRRLGLIDRDAEGAVLALRLRDPGGDLTSGFRFPNERSGLPLTRAVASALSGSSGYDVDGYRDYRGVLVVGSWRWLPQLRIGIATEVDAVEAFQTLTELDAIFGWLFSLVLLSSVGVLVAVAVSAGLARRAMRAERTAEYLGQYQLKRKLGEGGMGAVYLAEHALLRRPAAIKLLRENRASPEDRSRFEREINVTATLSHCNTVAVYDHGVARDGTVYCVMEYVDGLTLEQLIEIFGPVSPPRAVHLLRQLCGALAEAHAAGLVHRDIKPANLMVCIRCGVADVLKVLDFGLAKSLAISGQGITEAKIVLGTPHYMAPELFESSAQASPQSDLYAVGAVGYFLLTGRTLFVEDTIDALCMAHLTRSPVLPSVRLNAPLEAQLESALLACLAKNRDARPRSAGALLALLERCPCAYAWSHQDAESWWSERRDQLEKWKPSLAAEPGPAARMGPAS